MPLFLGFVLCIIFLRAFLLFVSPFVSFSSAGAGSESEEGVGSKGNADSTGAHDISKSNARDFAPAPVTSGAPEQEPTVPPSLHVVADVAMTPPLVVEVEPRAADADLATPQPDTSAAQPPAL